MKSHLPSTDALPRCDVVVLHPDGGLADLLQEALGDAAVQHEPGLDGGLVRLRTPRPGGAVGVVLLDLGPVPRDEVPRVLGAVMAADPRAQIVVTRARGSLEAWAASTRLWVHRQSERPRADDARALVSLVTRARKRWELQRLWEPAPDEDAGAAAARRDARQDAARRVLRVVEGQLHGPLADLADRLAAAALDPDSGPLTQLAGEAARLVDKLDVVRELCRLDLGQEAPVMAVFALPRLVSEVLARRREAALGWSGTLAVSRLPDAPTHVHGAEKVIRRALSELVGNAMRAGGGVSVGVDLRERHDGGFIARFSVDDAGSGIPEGELEGAWARYTGLGAPGEEPGDGVGLAVARALVEAARGRCGVMSAVGQGSTFWFELPVAAARRRGANATLPMLVVEDDPVNTLVVRRILEREGFRVETTDDPLDAVRRVQEGRYALVLMDVHLAGTDGLELTRQIREREAGGAWRTEIVALSAAVTDDTPACCLRAGMDGFQPKPIQRALLVALATAALGRAEARVAAEAEAGPGASLEDGSATRGAPTG